MANYSRATTGLTQAENIGKNNNGKSTQVTALNGYLYYQISNDGSLLGSDIRTTETEVSISAIDSSASIILLTVADGTLFRKKEALEVVDSSGNHKANIHIADINSNVISCIYQTRVQEQEDIVIGDKIVLPIDAYLGENGIYQIDSKAFPYMIYKSESTDVVIGFDTNIKKK